MTKEDFIKKHDIEPHEVYAVFLYEIPQGKVKPRWEIYEYLKDLEEVYKFQEDFEKCSDIVEMRKTLNEQRKNEEMV
jgi:hypothetical protein